MVAIGFLDDGQVGSLAVLDQHQLALFPFVQLGHDRRNPFQSRQFRGRQPPMADDQREPSLRRGHDQQVLPDALGADGIGQLAHIANVAAGICRVRVDKRRFEHDHPAGGWRKAGGFIDGGDGVCGFHDGFPFEKRVV